MNAKTEDQPTTTMLHVPDMTCASCTGHLDEALRQIEGVHAVDVRLDDARIVVEHDPRRAPAELLRDVVPEVGYEAQLAA